MNIIKSFYCVALVVPMLVSCNKSQDIQNIESSDHAVISLKIGGQPTKASVPSTTNEGKVSSIQVFIFNGEAVDGYKQADAAEVSALSVDIDGTVGTREIWAVCNAPSLSSCRSRSALLESVSLLSDNSSDNYVMAGSLKNQSIGAEYSGEINVDRYAARIRLQKVTRKFKSEAYQSVKMRITKIYLTSVVGNELYDFGKPSNYTWLNASFGSSRALSAGNSFVYQKLSAPEEVSQNSSYDTEHVFYCYANQYSSDDASSPKTYKRTRLVVECQVDVNNNGVYEADEYYTYPISVGAIDSNTSYDIQELVITRLGNNSNGDDNADDGEDDDIDSISATVKIKVNPWSQVLVGESGIVTI